MAEAAVSFLCDRLVDLLNQVEFHADVQNRVERLQEELRRMRCFLRDADTKQDEDERVRNWVSDIRNVSFDAEDIIDTFILKIKPWKKNKKQHFVKRCVSYLTGWKLRSKILRDLQAIHQRLESIATSREIYGIKNIGDGTTLASETLRKWRRSSPHGKDKDIVGLEDATSKLVSQLTDSGDRWHAISIVGMGGLGKTTLARKVYNHSDIKIRFPSRAWVYVSQEFHARDILQAIIRQIASPRARLEAMTDEELEELLYNNLVMTRYLLVLDDIWCTQDWDCLARAFPDKSNGSRLLLTTRNRNVAQHVDPLIVSHDLQFLSKENSWELFCKRAFIHGNDTQRSSLLEEIGREIVERCAGLPLAIIVTGGLLSTKRKSGDWERVLNNMDSLFARDSTGVSAILALSYNDLPYYLKSCFLYLGQFPEDFSIPTHKLFRLWVAEGLVPAQEARMEDVAEDFLNELVERNMVQVEKWSVNERAKRCRLHDLLRDLAISKAKVENFFGVPENSTSSTRCRRYPIYSRSHLTSLEHSPPQLRSLLFFRVVSQVRYKYFQHARNLHDFSELADANLDHISNNFKLLRTLDLEGISCSSIPKTIGKLMHLKYLGLKQTNIQLLPSTIVSLRNLQTLDISGNFHLRLVPNVICYMKNLRNLYMCGHKFSSPLRVDTLENLQILSDIHVDDWKENNSANLTNLRKLGLRGDLNSDTNKIFQSIVALLQLRSLKLQSEDAEFPSLGQLASLRCLVKLHLVGRVTKLQSPEDFPQNLSQITLEYTHLEQDSVEILEVLETLVVLRLRAQSYMKEKLVISSHGFHQLEYLELSNLDSLEELNIAEGALTRLKTLKITNCKGLKMLPEEMKSLTSLHELIIEDMPRVFVQKLRGKDFFKVEHILSIVFV